MPEFWRYFLTVPVTDSAPLLVYQIAVTFFAVCTAINAIGDWFAFQRPPQNTKTFAATPSPQKSLSVLIPARNEAANIGACVESLLTQQYPGPLEILVLDDRSEDTTAEIVQKIIDSVRRDGGRPDQTIRLLRGAEVWSGWKGKPNAMRQLAAAANGELLLLTDADCLFEPRALAAAVAHRGANGGGLPVADSSFGMRDVLGKRRDSAAILYYLCHAARAKHLRQQKSGVCGGERSVYLDSPARPTYAALGGHEAVKAEMAEDVVFARHVKRSGLRLVYGDGSQTYRVRMYNSFLEIWDGFSKNLFSAMGRSLPIVAVWCLFVLTTQLLPFAFLAQALLTGNRSVAGFLLPLMQIAIALGIRAALALRFRLALWAILTHPLGWLIFLGIALNSAYLSLSGKGHSWKGRVYTQ